ncbi:hypothetical protein NFJ02_06g129250 [Pycnococcus provasolii]
MKSMTSTPRRISSSSVRAPRLRVAPGIRVGLGSGRSSWCRPRASAEDVTKKGATPFIDAIAQFVSNSPINEGKKWFAKQQAGDYDENRVRQKLEDFIAENDIAMFSFPS